MDMWRPYGLGRGAGVGGANVNGSRPFPLKGEISLAGVFPFAGVSGSAPMEIIVETIILLIIIIDAGVEFTPAHFCSTVQLELFLWNLHFCTTK